VDMLVIAVSLATIIIEDLGGPAWFEEISPGLADAEARHQATSQDLRAAQCRPTEISARGSRAPATRP